MSEELEACPFCKSKARWYDSEFVCCWDADCVASGLATPAQWNTRPLESALRAQLGAAARDLTTLRAAAIEAGEKYRIDAENDALCKIDFLPGGNTLEGNFVVYLDAELTRRAASRQERTE